MEFTYALRFRFDATNNEAEYEALIAGLRIAEQIGVKNLQANMDSRLVANQVNEIGLGNYLGSGSDSRLHTYGLCVWRTAGDEHTRNGDWMSDDAYVSTGVRGGIWNGVFSRVSGCVCGERVSLKGDVGEMLDRDVQGNHRLGCHVDGGLDQPAAELGEYLHITLTRVTGIELDSN
ncbi:reverse transcriptase domain-containing protein [Tanacetum coccineum]